MSDTAFHDLDDYIALPRLGGLALSPDGSRLVVGVSTLDEDRTKYQPALWEVDPAGERPAAPPGAGWVPVTVVPTAGPRGVRPRGPDGPRTARSSGRPGAAA